MKITTEQKETVKRRLLGEAARHFAKVGYDAANINEIATGAGYAKGTIYNYFKSKSELFGEVIAEAARRTVEMYNSEGTHESVRQSLIELAKADVSVLREDESFVKILVSEAMSPISDNYGSILAHLGAFIDAISGILEVGVMKGEIRRDVPVSRLSLVFLGLLTIHYVQHWQSGGNWPKLEDIPELVVTLFVDGVGSRVSGNAIRLRS